ncbi:hypothetical protein F5B19DRAFT_291467 [Rostrohypoxylon terebratum]|nr:hypothetical protein F5B19DRAFT_291467 [Rostrohypoxylon terebratum]
MAGVEGASAIAGLFSLGIQITTALYAVADGIGSAGEEVRSVARDVDTAMQVMKTIQGVLDKQPHINDEISGIIKRIMDICHQIFKIYDVLQKSLVPLMGRYQDSERKLEQFGLRLEWYFRSKDKITSCRQSLQQQIAMLTPILTLLSIDRSETAHNNYYVQNIQVKYILENSTANLQHGDRDERRRSISIDSSRPTLLPPHRDTSRGRPESRGASTTTEPSDGQTTLVRYHSSSKTSENPSEEEIGPQVEEELDRSLEAVSNQDIEIIRVETYSVEIQFSRAVQRMLADLENNNNNNAQASPETRSPYPDQIITPKSTVPDQEEKWTQIYRPDGTSGLFPVDTIDTTKKFIIALLDLGFNISIARDEEYLDLDYLDDSDVIEKYRFDPASLAIYPGVLDRVLTANHIRITDHAGALVIPRLWERYANQPMTIYLKSTKPKLAPVPEKNGLLSRLKRVVRG